MTTMSAVSSVIIRSFLLVLLSVVQVEGCFEDYPLSELIINITSEVDSWYHAVYKNSSLANDASGDLVSVVLKQMLLPDSTFFVTVSAANEIGTGAPSDDVKFCELFGYGLIYHQTVL